MRGGDEMPDYQKLYTMLFNSMTDAVNAIEKDDIESAKRIMMNAQQKAEDMYVESEDPEV